MSTQPDQENFDALRRALKLKRYEQPPPRYFNEFSSQVVARLRAGETRSTETLIERAAEEAPWIVRVLSAFQAKPAFAGIFATAACALMIGGVVFSERPAAGPIAESPDLPTVQHSSLVADGSNLAKPPFANWDAKVNEVNATNGSSSLFDSLQPQGQLAPVMGFDSFRK